VWGGEAGKPLKPDAACLRNVCGALGVVPAEAIMVGDSLTDVDAARAAGCPVIAVAHGYERRPPDSLGADVVCAGLAETAEEISRRLAADQTLLRWPA
jgi:phosphoglycolate phosphatase